MTKKKFKILNIKENLKYLVGYGSSQRTLRSSYIFDPAFKE